MSYYKDHDPDKFGGSGGFFKLKDGENIVRLLTEPVHFMQVFMGPGIKPLIVRKEDEIPEGKKGTHRFMMYVYSYASNSIMLAEFATTIINALADLSKSSQYAFDTDAPPYDVVITKKGEGLDTSYTLTPGRNEKALGKAIMDELKEKEPCEEIKAKRYAEQNPGSDIKKAPDSTPPKKATNKTTIDPNETEDERTERIKGEAAEAFD